MIEGHDEKLGRRPSFAKVSQLVLFRGKISRQFDEPGALCISTSKASDERPLHGLWASFDFANRYLSVATATAEEKFPLTFMADESCFILPERWTSLWELPSIVCFVRPGLMSAMELHQSLDRVVPRKKVLHLGACEWLGDTFTSTPTAFRASNGTYSLYLPAGGDLGISMEWPVPEGGISVDCLSEEAQLGNPLHAVVDLFKRRCSSPVQSDTYLECLGTSIQEAIALVVMRQAWGRLPMPIALPGSLNPAWRRLAQHLDAKLLPPKDQRLRSMRRLSVMDFASCLPKIPMEHLLTRINAHSEVIPRSLYD